MQNYSTMLLLHEVPATLGCAAVFYGLACTPLLRWADNPPSDRVRRVSSIDGLRGVLALAVFLCHAAMFRSIVIRGSFGEHDDHFRFILGSGAVGVFFMITGYLFFDRLIAERGAPAWRRLYVGRVFRIAPVYLVAVASVFAIVAWRTGLHRAVPLAQLARQCATWLALGIGAPVDINGLGATWLIIAGVIWSLRYEWAFYASLPLLAWLVRRRAAGLALAVALPACLVWSRLLPPASWPTVPLAAALFGTGMVAALWRRSGRMPGLRDRTAAPLVLLLVTGVFACRNAYAAPAVLLLGGAFLLVVSGATMGGFLVSRAARRIGDISYPIYLLHGPIYDLMIASPLRDAFAHSTIGFYGLTLASGVVVLVVAQAIHVAVERPGVSLGKVAADWLLRDGRAGLLSARPRRG